LKNKNKIYFLITTGPSLVRPLNLEPATTVIQCPVQF